MRKERIGRNKTKKKKLHEKNNMKGKCIVISRHKINGKI